MSRFRLTVIAVAWTASSCQCRDSVNRPEPALVAEPQALDFGPVALGERLSLDLRLTSTSRAPVDVSVSVDGPFEVDPSVSLAGGDSTVVPITFIPVSLTTAAATLSVRFAGSELLVPLTGSGLPACEPRICTAASFDLATRRCIETNRADGSECETRCVSQGRCSDGQCVGQSEACSDGNACTVDVCSPEVGCSHVPLECPVPLCQAARCDPASGCRTVPVTDGTPCGSTTCASAHVCLNGRCQEHQKPGGDLACRYTSVVAGSQFTCAVNKLGKLRCWGQLASFDEAWPSSASRPIQLNSVNDVVAVDVATDLCAATARGSIWCNSMNGPNGGALPGGIVRLSLGSSPVSQSTGFVLDRSGRLSSWSFSQRQLQPMPFPYDAPGIVDFTAHGNLCLMFSDGGVSCQGTALPLPRPAHKLMSWQGGWVFVVDAQDTVTWPMTDDAGVLPTSACADGGVKAIGGSDRSLCVVSPQGAVGCTDFKGPCNPVPIPDAVTQLTANNNRHVCALTVADEIYCWGENGAGQLGESSARHVESVPLVTRGARDVFAEGTSTYVLVGETLFGWGTDLFDLDGGAVLVDGGYLTASDLGRVPHARRLLGNGYVLGDTGTLECWSPGRPLAPLRDTDGGLIHLSQCDNDVCWTDDGRRLTLRQYSSCLPGWFPPARDRCLIERDGGVSCRKRDESLVSVPLMSAATSLDVLAGGRELSGCARLVSGEVSCWQQDAGTVHVGRIPGLFPLVETVVGGLESGCALIGLNIVQCWGRNYFGQLGRDGPGSSTAVTVPFSERIVQLSGGGSAWGLTESGVGTSELSHVCVRTAAGAVWCWGSNSKGQLGPVLQSSIVPVRVTQ